MIMPRILALIESVDTLAAVLQTLRMNPTPENAYRLCVQVQAIWRECDKLANELANGVEL